MPGDVGCTVSRGCHAPVIVSVPLDGGAAGKFVVGCVANVMTRSVIGSGRIVRSEPPAVLAQVKSVFRARMTPLSCTTMSVQSPNTGKSTSTDGVGELSA